MDAIDRAIINNKHLTNNPQFSGKTWKDFDDACRGKKLVIFGIGEGADCYFLRYGDKKNIEAVVDNSRDIQKHPVKNLVFENTEIRENILVVENPRILDKYNKDDIVVLISSLNHFEEIGEQISQLGINDYYSVLCMEAAFRIKYGITDSVDRKKEFYEWCVSQPLYKNKIVVFSVNDGAGHGKSIVEMIRSNNKNIDIVWFVRNNNVILPDGVRSVLYRDYRNYTFNLLTSSIWLSDKGVPISDKKDDQVYIQMKHWSSITLKMFGYDELRYRGERDYNKFGIHGFDKIDYVFVGSEFDEKTCRSGFGFSGDAIHVGSPRSDVLFRDRSGFSKLRERYGIATDEKCLLYAPTFRRICKRGTDAIYADSLDYGRLRETLVEKYNCEWRILLRLHPYVAGLSRNMRPPDYVTDVSDYYDSEELVVLSDIMITDYSSIMFEPAFVRKPVFLYATDRQKYLEEERGFLIDYDTLPFPIAETNEQLAENILNFDQEKYESDVTAFLDKYGVHEDGHASERAAEFILGLMGEV